AFVPFSISRAANRVVLHFAASPANPTATKLSHPPCGFFWLLFCPPATAKLPAPALAASCARRSSLRRAASLRRSWASASCCGIASTPAGLRFLFEESAIVASLFEAVLRFGKARPSGFGHLMLGRMVSRANRVLAAGSRARYLSAIFLSASLILSCQPGPESWKYSRTS